MVIQNISSGPNEAKLLLTLAEKRISVFTAKDAKEILQMTDAAAAHILMNLVRKRRLQRIEKGKYLLIPDEAGVDRYWAEEPWVVVPHLVDEYYVGFWTAMNYWDMTEQIPYTVYVATRKQKKKSSLKFGNQKFQFITLSEKKFFGFIEAKTNKTKFNISTKEKTIVDGLTYPKYCGGIPEVAKAMWSVRKNINWQDVLKLAEKVDVNVVIRRLGYLLNILEIENNVSKLIANNLQRYPYHYLDPSTSKNKIESSKEYGLIINRTKHELLGWKDY
ncbi:MAG: hypothetical protein MAG458_01305 [Nitrosopumilus sp.]|nr:hypothetical protein [Nitrosopumilus sp.]